MHGRGRQWPSLRNESRRQSGESHEASELVSLSLAQAMVAHTPLILILESLPLVPVDRAPPLLFSFDLPPLLLLVFLLIFFAAAPTLRPRTVRYVLRCDEGVVPEVEEVEEKVEP